MISHGSIRAFAALAALMGAAGVALAAMAAHGGDATRLGVASSMLLFHAPAILGALALVVQRTIHPLFGRIAIAGLLLGTALFAGDLTLRHFAGQALFPMAAPIGGTLLIASWLALGISAVLPQRGRPGAER